MAFGARAMAAARSAKPMMTEGSLSLGNRAAMAVRPSFLLLASIVNGYGYRVTERFSLWPTVQCWIVNPDDIFQGSRTKEARVIEAHLLLAPGATHQNSCHSASGFSASASAP